MASGVLSSELLFGTHPGLTLPKSQTKTPDFLGFHSDDGTRTHDLLHGKRLRSVQAGAATCRSPLSERGLSFRYPFRDPAECRPAPHLGSTVGSIIRAALGRTHRASTHRRCCARRPVVSTSDRTPQQSNPERYSRAFVDESTAHSSGSLSR
jgi:hypothetical protein